VRTIDNARAIEAALQYLQGPPSSGKLLVKATGADVKLFPGDVALPVLGNAIEQRAGVYAKRNPATRDLKPAKPGDPDEAGHWLVTAAGTLVDVESIQGGTHTNKPGGTPYRWDPPLDGIELVSVADAGGLTGGAFSGASGGLKQFAHFDMLNLEPNQYLWQSNTFAYPAAILSWKSAQPLDGSFVAIPGPRTARVSQSATLYRNTWWLTLLTSRLESVGLRSLEASSLRDDAREAIYGARRIRDRCFIVSVEPGANLPSIESAAITPTVRADRITIETAFVLDRASQREYHDWLRTRLRQQTPAVTDPAPPPPLDLPNIIVPMPPNGPGSPPFP
jgi:hypothetical protein